MLFLSQLANGAVNMDHMPIIPSLKIGGRWKRKAQLAVINGMTEYTVGEPSFMN